MNGLGLIFAVGALVAAWLWATGARERVDRIGREICAELEVQRLDESVTLRRIGIARAPWGMALSRVFSFEFSTNGADRRRADVCLFGRYPAWVRVDHPDGPILIDLLKG